MPMARPRGSGPRTAPAPPRGTRTRRRPPRSAAAPRLLVWGPWRDRRSRPGRTAPDNGPRGRREGRPLVSFVAGSAADRCERVDLAVAVERVVRRTAGANLRRAVVDRREERMDRQIGRARPRIGW